MALLVLWGRLIMKQRSTVAVAAVAPINKPSMAKTGATAPSLAAAVAVVAQLTPLLQTVALADLGPTALFAFGRGDGRIGFLRHA